MFDKINVCESIDIKPEHSFKESQSRLNNVIILSE